MNTTELHFTDISTGKTKLINKESHRYCVIPIEAGGRSLYFKFDARMKIFKHKDSYSLGITIPEDLIRTFEQFEKRINELAMEKKHEVRALVPNFGNYRPGDFQLLKTDKSENSKIYAKLYVNDRSPNTSTAPFYRVIGEKTKQRIKDNLDLAGVPLNGSVVLQIKQLFCGNVKALTCVVQEVLVREEIHPQSAFDDYEDE